MSDWQITSSDAMWGFVALFVLLALEALTGQLKGATRRDFGLTGASFLLNSFAMRPLAGLGVAWVAGMLVPAYAGVLADVPLWQAFIGCFVVMEFIFYWVHRWSHEGQKLNHPLAWLWKIHRTHHSAEHINVSVVVRQNIFWVFFTPHTWLVALASYLGMVEGSILALLAMYAWNLFTHLHWRLEEGWQQSKLLRMIQHVVITPTLHHAHHGYGKNGKMYRNYALCLSVYDWMFGTLYIPEGRPSRYGAPGENPHWAEELFYPLNLLMPRKAKTAAQPEGAPAYGASTKGEGA